MKNSLLNIASSRKEIEIFVKDTQKNYRPKDPGWYLYKMLMNDIEYFSDEYIELIYIILISWNMNSRGAKLAEYDVFCDSIRSNKEVIYRLQDQNLETAKIDTIKKYLWKLFENLSLVAPGKPKFVTYTKTFHFLFPELFPPMDRAYTLKFYYGHTNLPKKDERQFKKPLIFFVIFRH